MAQVDGDEPTQLPRRSALRRGAAVAAVAWSAPVVHSLTTPAYAEGSPEPPPAGPEARCFTQTFLVDKNNQPLTYTPGRDRSFLVDLGVTFVDITSITVRLYESPSDPVEAGEDGAILFRSELRPNSAGGVIFLGSQADPITIGFSPGGGSPPEETYADLLRDGKVELIVNQSSLATGSFTLLRVEIEVCGTTLS